MKDLIAAIDRLMDQPELDENGGGLLSRASLRAASELRLELHRAKRLPADDEWRALVHAWSIRCDELEAVVAEAADDHDDDHLFVEAAAALLAAPNPPLVPGQPVTEAQSDG